MTVMFRRPMLTAAGALAAIAAVGQARAQTPAAAPEQPASQARATALQPVVVTAKRDRRVSKGATNLPMEIKDTPQSISTIDKDELLDLGITGANDALRYSTGINVEQYETNRAEINARGFQVMLTQIDGLGMTNDWGTIVGQQDTYLFERIEMIRGANGLLTGVGNASGTINYVRKRPTNQDGGEAILTGGSYGLKRVALDYNKVFTADGSWAGRLVVAQEDKGSYIRALHDKRSTVYGVVDGQIGDNGVLTFGFSYADMKQRSPMWGSLTINYADGSLADFDASSSTSQDWTYWNTRSYNLFAEYTHTLSPDWEAKVTVNHRRGTEDTKIFYAYSPTGYLNPDNTGLVGWPYRSESRTGSDIVDLNLNGHVDAFGRRHDLVVGLSHSRQSNATNEYDATGYIGLPLPAFPYGGNVYAEPPWGALSPGASGDQTLLRLYGATRIAVTDRLKGILGFNAVRLTRNGASIYGNGTVLDDSRTNKVSPYVGATYDITKDLLGYVSYSDIFQNQDQADIDGIYLPPMKGVNTEAGVKAEWLDRQLLTTFALFSAKQEGLATYAGINGAGNYYYEPKDVTSRGFEVEVTGRIGKDARLTAGFTKLTLTGPDGNDIYEWVPRRTVNLRADSRVPGLPKLRLGVAARWQSDVSKIGGARQDAYLLAEGFAAYELTDKATLRFNVKNLLDKKYLNTVEYGAIYGAPRNFAVSLDYKL